jgi:predicted AlkP superfamily phosphohydrolase/phosphomutase
MLALKNGARPQDQVGAPPEIDWSRTRAYAVGLGGIYLNLKGREREGIVQEGTEADQVRKAIQSGLAGLADSATQSTAIRDVRCREELYSGPYAANAPDLLVNFCPGFRVSWQSAVGGFANSLIEDNMRRWSGDHIIDPEAVPGVLFVSQNPHPVAGAPLLPDFGRSGNIARIIDLAPTILSYLGVTVPKTMEGTSLI